MATLPTHEQYAQNKDYQALYAKWREYKNMETMANTGRLAVEKAMVELVSPDLREKGVNHFPNDLDITTGMEEKWSQEEIAIIKSNYDAKQYPNLPFFPFKIEYKPDAAKMKVLKDDMNAVFIKIFSPALTIKPSKPSFSIKK